MIHIITGTFSINKISQRARHTFTGHTKITLYNSSENIYPLNNTFFCPDVNILMPKLIHS